MVKISENPAVLQQLAEDPQKVMNPASITPPVSGELQDAIRQIQQVPEVVALAAAFPDEMARLRQLYQSAPQQADELLANLQARYRAARLQGNQAWQQMLAQNPQALEQYQNLVTEFTREQLKQYPQFPYVVVTDPQYYQAAPPNELLLAFAEDRKPPEPLASILNQWWQTYGISAVDQQVFSQAALAMPDATFLAALPSQERANMWRAASGFAPSDAPLMPIIMQPLPDQPMDARLAFAVAENARLWGEPALTTQPPVAEAPQMQEGILPQYAEPLEQQPGYYAQPLEQQPGYAEQYPYQQYPAYEQYPAYDYGYAPDYAYSAPVTTYYSPLVPYYYSYPAVWPLAYSYYPSLSYYWPYSYYGYGYGAPYFAFNFGYGHRFYKYPYFRYPYFHRYPYSYGRYGRFYGDRGFYGGRFYGDRVYRRGAFDRYYGYGGRFYGSRGFYGRGPFDGLRGYTGFRGGSFDRFGRTFDRGPTFDRRFTRDRFTFTRDRFGRTGTFDRRGTTGTFDRRGTTGTFDRRGTTGTFDRRGTTETFERRGAFDRRFAGDRFGPTGRGTLGPTDRRVRQGLVGGRTIERRQFDRGAAVQRGAMPGTRDFGTRLGPATPRGGTGGAIRSAPRGGAVPRTRSDAIRSMPRGGAARSGAALRSSPRVGSPGRSGAALRSAPRGGPGRSGAAMRSARPGGGAGRGSAIRSAPRGGGGRGSAVRSAPRGGGGGRMSGMRGGGRGGGRR